MKMLDLVIEFSQVGPGRPEIIAVINKGAAQLHTLGYLEIDKLRATIKMWEEMDDAYRAKR